MIDVLDLSIDIDVQKLKEFSLLEHPSTFRYFKNRVFEQAIKTHVVTLMYSTYGYAHIDKDVKSGRHYLGICVMPEQQGKGIGKKLMDMLIKLYDGDIYLTVDKENRAAISLYEKYGFKRIEDGHINYTYKLSRLLTLEVSVGEAVDKLTILDIKLEKITDVIKKSNCKAEYDAVYRELSVHMNKCSRFYSWLKYINLQIWNLQDEMREKNNYSNEVFNKILDLNDMRFRVKKRINSLFETSFQEQKGYSNKTGLFLSHLGMGDMINMNGAIRYAALMVDKLYVICKSRNANNTREMFADDPTIHIVECKDNDFDVNDIIIGRRCVYKSNITGIPSQYVPHKYFEEDITRKFLSGGWCGRSNLRNAPFDFYDDLKFSYDVRKIFAYFNTYAKLEHPTIPYIFTHASSSFTKSITFVNKWDINEILTIDPNKNYYEKGHKWYDIAESYINKPIFSYVDVIKFAKELHVTDSSFFCLACYVTPTADVKVCYDRLVGNVSKEFSFESLISNVQAF